MKCFKENRMILDSHRQTLLRLKQLLRVQLWTKQEIKSNQEFLEVFTSACSRQDKTNLKQVSKLDKQNLELKNPENP